jgi:aerobic carbon-monoxide dehydrogenase medium subunit
VQEVLALLAEHGDEAKLLAGGQSLVPLLNLRLARPYVVIDLAAVDGLARIEQVDGLLVLGPMTRQRAMETSTALAAACPLLVEAIGHIGHVQIRNRGTVGGSLAHADPAAELPAVAVALGAEMVVRSTKGERVVPAQEFFEGPFTTTLQADELLTEIRMPVTEGRGTAFTELARRTGDFAIAGVAAVVRFQPGSRRVAEAGLAALGVGPTPIRLRDAEAAVVGSDLSDASVSAAAAVAMAAVSPVTDVHADEDYRRRLIGVLVSRALHRSCPAAEG